MKKKRKGGSARVYVPDPPLQFSIHEALSYLDLGAIPSLLPPGARRRPGMERDRMRL